MQLQGIKLALLDDLVNFNMKGSSLSVVGPEVNAARKKLESAIKFFNQGLSEAKKGLESAKQLGDAKTIETFGRWIKRFEGDIALANKNIKALSTLDII
jgi:hypothetical protein